MKRDLETILQNTTKKGDCLEWTKCFNTDGYPRAVIDGNNNSKVHRVVYELHNNCPVDNKVVRHRCDNIKCVNPLHLQEGTHKDNMQDRDTRLRHGGAKLTPERVKLIRSLRGVVSQKYIAAMLGIDSRTVSSVQLRRHWKWLD